MDDTKGRFVFLQLPIGLQLGALDSLGLPLTLVFLYSLGALLGWLARVTRNPDKKRAHL